MAALHAIITWRGSNMVATDSYIVRDFVYSELIEIIITWVISLLHSLSLSHTHFLSQFAIPVIGEILFSFPMSSITYPFKVNEYYQYMQQRQFLIN